MTRQQAARPFQSGCASAAANLAEPAYGFVKREIGTMRRLRPDDVLNDFAVQPDFHRHHGH